MKMQEINELVDSLVRCVPRLDPHPLRAQPPAGIEQLDVLQWLADQLEQQGLLVYEEWSEYFGGVPALRSLADVDTSGHNAYIFCVKDDDQALAQLDRSLQAFGMRINPRDALDDQAVRAHIDALLAA